MNLLARTRFSPLAAVLLAAGFLLIGLVAALAPPALQWAILAGVILFLLTRVVTLSDALGTLIEQADLLRLPLAIAKDQRLLEISRRMGVAIQEIGSQFDPICRTLALTRLEQIERELGQIAQGRFVFSGTETWRVPYEQLLRSQGLYRYRSVAVVKTANYWQDEPGRQSTLVNCDVAQSGAVTIERIVVLADSLWPRHERFPMEPILHWLKQQARAGVQLKLVRQSVIDEEPDLIADYGIYGNRAVGFQEIDDRGRTIQFTLTFDMTELLAAEARWERLSIYAGSFPEGLDQLNRTAYDRN